MEYWRFMKYFYFVFAIIVISGLTPTVLSSLIDGDCCYPERFNGELSLPDDLAVLRAASGAASRLLRLRFAVDYVRGRLSGEYYATEGEGGGGTRLRRIRFLANLNDESGQPYLTAWDTWNNNCRRIGLSTRLMDRCQLKKSYLRHQLSEPDDRNRAINHLIYAMRYKRNQGENYYPPFYRFQHPFLLAEATTCLPRLHFDLTHPSRRVGFHRMRAGLGYFEDMGEISGCHDDWDWQERDYYSSSSSEEEGSDRTRGSLRLDLILYLLGQFAPVGPPKPCTGPKQWQGSALKTIVYTNSKTQKTNEAVTQIPKISVDHTAQKFAADLIAYVNNVKSSNITLVGAYGATLNLYVMDWSLNTCLRLNITDAGPMWQAGVPENAEFFKTLTLGGPGPINSAKMNVWYLNNENSTDAILKGDAYLYVTDRCITSMLQYEWHTKLEKVWGNIMFSDVQLNIPDLSTAFAVPTECLGVKAMTFTMSELQSLIDNALSYIGG